MNAFKLAVLIAAILAPAAHASGRYCTPDKYPSGYNGSGMKVDKCGNIDLNYYIASCSHYFDLGYSSEFGTYDEYDGPYPETGWFSSELEHTRQIKSSDVKFYKDKFKEAHEFQYSGYRSLAQMEFGLKRNQSIMKDDPVSYQAYKQKFLQLRDDIEGQISYNVSKTYNDIKSKLSYVDPSLLNRNGGGSEEVITSWTYYQECKTWWSYEERNIRELKQAYPEYYK